MNKQPPAIVRVRVRRGIVRIPSKHTSSQTIVVTAAHFENTGTKDGDKTHAAPKE